MYSSALRLGFIACEVRSISGSFLLLEYLSILTESLRYDQMSPHSGVLNSNFCLLWPMNLNKASLSFPCSTFEIGIVFVGGQRRHMRGSAISFPETCPHN